MPVEIPAGKLADLPTDALIHAHADAVAAHAKAPDLPAIVRERAWEVVTAVEEELRRRITGRG